MPAPGFQVGAVRGRDVVLAKGLEIDLARALARRLGIPRVRFVNERLFSTLLRPGAIVEVAAAENVDLIVMATEGHHGWTDALRGSTTERVVREARCPVLSVPAG